MFAVLQTEKRAADFISRISERFTKSEPELIQVRIPGGAPFLTVRVKETKRGIPWDEVKQCAGRCSERMLLPLDTKLPENCGIGAFEPCSLPLKLCFNTAVRLISQSAINSSGLSVGIIDETAVLSDELEKIVMLASNTYVATQKMYNYERTAERFMRIYGAPLNLVNDADSLMNCDILIAPKLGLAEKSGARLVFCPKSQNENSEHVFCLIEGYGANAPESIMRLCPDNIDEYLFCCAVFELCSVRSIDTGIFKDIYFNSNPVSEYSASEKIRELFK